MVQYNNVPRFKVESDQNKCDNKLHQPQWLN